MRNLLEADRPVLYVGGGIVAADAAAELKEFAELLSLPVAHSLMGKGALPDDSPLVLGMTGFWGTAFVNETTRNADWILALGTRFAEADSSSWYAEYTFDIPATKLMQIDIDPAELGRNYPLEIGALADLKSALNVLIRVARRLAPSGVQRDELIAQIAASRRTLKLQNSEAQVSEDWPMRPERILSETREVLPPDAIITTDVGWNKNGVGQQFDILTPGTFLTPGGFATMGFGAPAAVGAKIAHPDRVVVSLVGDGGFGQNPAVLATAREENVAVVWVVMNNNAFGTIAGLEKAAFDTTYGTVFGKARRPDVHGLRGDRGSLRSAGDQGRLGCGVQARAGAGDRARRACRDRCVDGQRAHAHHGPLEHHGHLLARRDGRARRDALTGTLTDPPQDDRRLAVCMDATPQSRCPGRGDHAMPSGFRPVGINRLTDGSRRSTSTTTSLSSHAE